MKISIKTHFSILAVTTKLALLMILATNFTTITYAASTDTADTLAELPTDASVFFITGEETDPFTISYGEKTVTYIPMIHIGTPAFYKAVAEKVKIRKMAGATLYYEFIDFDALDDNNKRKARALVGILPTPHQYDELSGDGYIGQPNNDFLGLVNDKDVNVDVTPEELLEAYEKRFGPIVVTGIDATSDLSEMATMVSPMENVSKIILASRNQKIADTISNRQETDIVLLFGAAHGPGIVADLQLIDPNWRRTE
jgi:hypothetical protein